MSDRSMDGGPGLRPRPQIAEWRRARLILAGFDERAAAELAGERAVDLHALLELVDRGCPPRLATRILAPLEADRRPC